MKKIKVVIPKVAKEKKKSATASVAGLGALTPRPAPALLPEKNQKTIKVTIKNSKLTEE